MTVKISKLRKIDRLLNYNPDLPPEVILDHINRIDYDGLVSKIEKVRPLEQRTAKELREVASKLGIKYYNHKTKDELIILLREEYA